MRVDNNPAATLREQVNNVLFENYPYRIPIIGWQHEVEHLTRKDILNFYHNWYAPNNAVLVISGDVTVDQVRPLVEKYYGPIPARKLPQRVKWYEPKLKADRSVTMKDPRVKQPTWSRRFIAPSSVYGDTQYADALQVLSEILSGGATSRLYRTLVVEKKEAVETGAWYDGDGRGPGTFGFYISPPSGGDVHAAAAAMNAQIKKLIEHGVTQEEVSRAISQLQASAIYARDSYRTPARVLGSALAVGETIKHVESWPERIGAVTAESVNKAIAAVFKDKHSVTALLLPQPTS